MRSWHRLEQRGVGMGFCDYQPESQSSNSGKLTVLGMSAVSAVQPELLAVESRGY